MHYARRDDRHPGKGRNKSRPIRDRARGDRREQRDQHAHLLGPRPRQAVDDRRRQLRHVHSDEPSADRHELLGALGALRPARECALAQGGRGARAVAARNTRGKERLGDTGWRGPSPPIGRHRYFFDLHALDCTLADLGAVSRRDLEAAMKGHVLATATLIGTYAKEEG
jgi:hypothetical protein